MRVQTVSTYLASGLGFEAVSDGLAVVEEGGYVRLLYGARTDSRLGSLTLAQGQTARTALATDPVIGTGQGLDIVVQNTSGAPRALVFSGQDGLVRQASMGANGQFGLASGVMTATGPLTGVTALEMFERGATDIAVVAQKGFAGLRIYSVNEAGLFTLTDTIADGPKSYLAGVSDLAALVIGGRSFLLAASASENGLSTYEIDASGRASLIDSLGAGNGLPIAGPAAMQVASIAGTSFAVIASTVSSSLTVVRINAMGVMFQTDHVLDDRASRFADVAALDLFTVSGRVFVVAAGSDSGLSVLELLPDGRLSHILSHALETGTGIAAVTGIETTLIGNTAAILLTDARGDRIYHFSMDISGVGPLIADRNGTIAGTALDDRIFGSARPDAISGGAGDDFLHDGAGADVLTGGAGADVFVFTRDRAMEQITDFQDGLDRIDISDWGRFYSVSALSITATATGALISFGAESLTVINAAGRALALTNDDFIF